MNNEGYHPENAGIDILITDIKDAIDSLKSIASMLAAASSLHADVGDVLALGSRRMTAVRVESVSSQLLAQFRQDGDLGSPRRGTRCA